jgi:PHS family inorganic phosphate transporter-like MFS transporter
MLTGIFSTLLLPETKGKTLEELSNEDQDGFIRGKWFVLSFLVLPSLTSPLGAGRSNNTEIHS